MSEWANFFLAQAGASAALTGLIFVAVSINLNKILASSTLPIRAFAALLILLVILIVSSLMLVPGQSPSQVGLKILGIGVITWVVVMTIDVNILRRVEREYRRANLLNVTLSQVAVLPYLAAGIILLSGNLDGFYWLTAAIIFSYIKALLDAWVLLVEINR